jgi:hypothetical protein
VPSFADDSNLAALTKNILTLLFCCEVARLVIVNQFEEHQTLHKFQSLITKDYFLLHKSFSLF